MTVEQIQAMFELRTHYFGVIKALEEMQIQMKNISGCGYVCRAKEEYGALFQREREHFITSLKKLDECLRIDGTLEEW